MAARFSPKKKTRLYITASRAVTIYATNALIYAQHRGRFFFGLHMYRYGRGFSCSSIVRSLVDWFSQLYTYIFYIFFLEIHSMDLSAINDASVFMPVLPLFEKPKVNIACVQRT